MYEFKKCYKNLYKIYNNQFDNSIDMYFNRHSVAGKLFYQDFLQPDSLKNSQYAEVFKGKYDIEKLGRIRKSLLSNLKQEKHFNELYKKFNSKTYWRETDFCKTITDSFPN